MAVGRGKSAGYSQFPWALLQADSLRVPPNDLGVGPWH